MAYQIHVYPGDPNYQTLNVAYLATGATGDYFTHSGYNWYVTQNGSGYGFHRRSDAGSSNIAPKTVNLEATVIEPGTYPLVDPLDTQPIKEQDTADDEEDQADTEVVDATTEAPTAPIAIAHTRGKRFGKS